MYNDFELQIQQRASDINLKLELLRSIDINWHIRYGEKGCCSLCILRAYDTFIADGPNKDRGMDNLRKRYGC